MEGMAQKIDIYIPCSQGPHRDRSSTCPALQSIADTCGQSGAPACECLVGQSSHTYIRTQAFVHIRTYTATHAPISTCIHIGIRIHICTNRHTNTSAHATPNVHAHKHTHTHTYTCTQTKYIHACILHVRVLSSPVHLRSLANFLIHVIFQTLLLFELGCSRSIRVDAPSITRFAVLVLLLFPYR